MIYLCTVTRGPPVQPARFPRSKKTAFEGLSGKSSGPRGPRRSILLASSRHSAVLQPFPVPLPTWGEQTGSPRLDIGYHHGIRNPNSSRLFGRRSCPSSAPRRCFEFRGASYLHPIMHPQTQPRQSPQSSNLRIVALADSYNPPWSCGTGP